MSVIKRSLGGSGTKAIPVVSSGGTAVEMKSLFVEVKSSSLSGNSGIVG